MSITVLLVTLLLFLLLYVWPAVASGRSLTLVAFGVSGIIVMVLWASLFVGPWAMEEPRGLGAAIDFFVRIVASAYLLVAGIVQIIRAAGVSAGYTGHRYWVAVVVGGVIPPFLVTIVL